MEPIIITGAERQARLAGPQAPAQRASIKLNQHKTIRRSNVASGIIGEVNRGIERTGRGGH